MSQCRCADIQIGERDVQKLSDLDGKFSSIDTALNDTEDATGSLKSAVHGAVEVSLGSVSRTHFSNAGRDARSSAAGAVSTRLGELYEALESWRIEDREYHERIAAEERQRQRDRERQRERDRKRRGW